MDACMDGWRHVWMYRQMDSCMQGRLDKQMDRQEEGCMDRQRDRWMDDLCMYWWTDGGMMEAKTDGQTDGCTDWWTDRWMLGGIDRKIDAYIRWIERWTHNEWMYEWVEVNSSVKVHVRSFLNPSPRAASLRTSQEIWRRQFWGNKLAANWHHLMHPVMSFAWGKKVKNHPH